MTSKKELAQKLRHFQTLAKRQESHQRIESREQRKVGMDYALGWADACEQMAKALEPIIKALEESAEEKKR